MWQSRSLRSSPDYPAISHIEHVDLQSHLNDQNKSGLNKSKPFHDVFCDLQPLGASDYLEMSRLFDTIFIRHIPLLTLNKKTQARRLITLVDALYDHKVSAHPARCRRPQTLWGLLFIMTATSSRCRWGWWFSQIIRWRTFSHTMGISVTMRATSWWTIWGWKGWELPLSDVSCGFVLFFNSKNDPLSEESSGFLTHTTTSSNLSYYILEEMTFRYVMLLVGELRNHKSYEDEDLNFHLIFFSVCDCFIFKTI